MTDAEVDAYFQSKIPSYDPNWEDPDLDFFGTLKYMSPEQLAAAGFRNPAFVDVDPSGPTIRLGPKVPTVDPLGPTTPVGPTVPTSPR